MFSHSSEIFLSMSEADRCIYKWKVKQNYEPVVAQIGAHEEQESEKQSNYSLV